MPPRRDHRIRAARSAQNTEEDPAGRTTARSRAGQTTGERSSTSKHPTSIGTVAYPAHPHEPKPVGVSVTSGDTALKLCQDLSHLVGMLMYEHAKSGGEMNEDVVGGLECIQIYMKKEPGSLYGNMLRDLHSRDIAEDRFRELHFASTGPCRRRIHS
jgi:hypothetical protein